MPLALKFFGWLVKAFCRHCLPHSVFDDFRDREDAPTAVRNIIINDVNTRFCRHFTATGQSRAAHSHMTVRMDWVTQPSIANQICVVGGLLSAVERWAGCRLQLRMVSHKCQCTLDVLAPLVIRRISRDKGSLDYVFSLVLVRILYTKTT